MIGDLVTNPIVHSCTTDWDIELDHSVSLAIDWIGAAACRADEGIPGDRQVTVMKQRPPLCQSNLLTKERLHLLEVSLVILKAIKVM